MCEYPLPAALLVPTALGEAKSTCGSRDETWESYSSDHPGALWLCEIKVRERWLPLYLSLSFLSHLPSPPPPSFSFCGSFPPWMEKRKQIISRVLVSHAFPGRVERRKETWPWMKLLNCRINIIQKLFLSLSLQLCWPIRPIDCVRQREMSFLLHSVSCVLTDRGSLGRSQWGRVYRLHNFGGMRGWCKWIWPERGGITLDIKRCFSAQGAYIAVLFCYRSEMVSPLYGRGCVAYLILPMPSTMPEKSWPFDIGW